MTKTQAAAVEQAPHGREVDEPESKGLASLQGQVADLMVELQACRDQLAERATAGPAAVVEALCRASKRIGPVPKDAQMETGQKYQYRSIRAIMAKAQEVFADEGIVIVPHKIKSREARDYTTNSGGQAMMTHHLFVWRIYCRTGDFLQVETFGEARDSGDKGANKAQTAAYKYAVIAALSLAEGWEDPDDERPADRMPEQQAQQHRQSKAQEQAAWEQAKGAFTSAAQSLTEEEKAAFRDWCDANGVPLPGARPSPDWVRPLDQWAQMKGQVERILQSRARDAVPDQEPERQAVAGEEAQEPVDRDEAMAAHLAAIREAEAAAPDPDPKPAAGPEAPPKADWKLLQCTKCRKDVNGYERMPCPDPDCSGYLTDEEPFAFPMIPRGDDARLVLRHRWAPRRGDARWPGQF